VIASTGGAGSNPAFAADCFNFFRREFVVEKIDPTILVSSLMAGLFVLSMMFSAFKKKVLPHLGNHKVAYFQLILVGMALFGCLLGCTAFGVVIGGDPEENLTPAANIAKMQSDLEEIKKSVGYRNDMYSSDRTAIESLAVQLAKYDGKLPQSQATDKIPPAVFYGATYGSMGIGWLLFMIGTCGSIISIRHAIQHNQYRSH